MNESMNNPAITIRNKSWADNEYIPTWVDVENVGLDQFFTRPAIAKECWKSHCRHISMCHIRAVLTEAGLVDV